MKQISQNYFDETVVSNMQLFDIDVDESIKETIQSFQLENIDLSNIIKDLIKYKEGHPSVLAFEKIKANVYKPNAQDISNFADVIKVSTDSMIAVKTLVAAMGAVSVLIDSYNYFLCHNDLISGKVALNALVTLIDGYPDILEKHHVEKLINYLFDMLTITEISIYEQMTIIYRILRLGATKNERNREVISVTSLIVKTLQFLKSLLQESCDMCTVLSLLLKESCAFLRVMTMDDDLRVEYGRGSQNARIISEDESFLQTMIGLARAKSKSSNFGKITDYFLTLSCVIVREETCLKFASFGGISLLMDTLYMNSDSAFVVASGLTLLKVVCGADDCKKMIANWVPSDNSKNLNGSLLIAELLEQHLKDLNVVNQALAAVAAITLRQPDVAKEIVLAGVPESFSKIFELHLSNPSTMRITCMAIRNCMSRCKELRSNFLGSDPNSDVLGIEKALNSILKISGCHDEAKAALRDLGCNVELKEPWKGSI